MKILFIIPEYSHGGTNKSLENLLSLIDKSKYDISIYCLYEDGGDYYKKVFAPYILKKSWLYYWLHDNMLTRKVMGLYNNVTKRDNFTELYKREARWLERNLQPDVVVGFQEGVATLFASFFANTHDKIAWYHSPYMSFDETNKKAFIERYRIFDHIVCVSNTFCDVMKRIFPDLYTKFVTIYNTLNFGQIIEKSNEHVPDFNSGNSCFDILSVGRFASKSQFHYIPWIVSEAKKFIKNKSFRWYIIAAGDECKEKTIRDIEKYQVQNDVILLGARDNPYSYMNQADVVVCTSDSESFSYVLAEAKILHTPVLSNDFPVAYEVVDEQTGWIANIKEMPELLARIIDDEDGIYHKKKVSISKYEYNNDKIIKQIDELFEN